MHRKCGIIFCENEHGTGEVTFPNLNEMDVAELHQRFINSPTEAQTRVEAKKAGWTRVNGADYCPQCKEAL